MEEAKSSMPALLVLDNMAILCPSSAQDSPEAVQDASGGALVSWLCDLLGSLRPAGQMPLPGAPSSQPCHGILCMGPTMTNCLLWYACYHSAGQMQVWRCPTPLPGSTATYRDLRLGKRHCGLANKWQLNFWAKPVFR